jgi:hypothetical protein
VHEAETYCEKIKASASHLSRHSLGLSNDKRSDIADIRCLLRLTTTASHKPTLAFSEGMLILKAILLHDYGVALSYLLPVSFCLCRVSNVVTSRHLQLNDLDVRYSRF